MERASPTLTLGPAIPTYMPKVSNYRAPQTFNMSNLTPLSIITFTLGYVTTTYIPMSSLKDP